MFKGWSTLHPGWNESNIMSHNDNEFFILESSGHLKKSLIELQIQEAVTVCANENELPDGIITKKKFF